MLHILVNLIFPPRCIFCGKYLGLVAEIEICLICGQKINFYEKSVKSYTNNQYCDEIYCFYEYAGMMKDCLIRFKFCKKPGYCRTLGRLIFENFIKMTSMSEFDIITCVPLHSARKKERGYNQSELLARVLSKQSGLPFASDLLIRVKNTRPQSLLSGNMRYQNIKDAFLTKEKNSVFKKRIIITDDIMTTGNTLEECARVLKQAGAEKVTAVVVASGRKC